MLHVKDDRAAGEKAGEGVARAPLCGAVHERREDHRAGRRGCPRAIGEFTWILDPTPAVTVAAERGVKDVFASPHDAFRHPGRPAGVEHVDVVGGARREVARGGSRRQRRLILIAESESDVQGREVFGNLGEQPGELRLEDDCLDVSVGQHVTQLVTDVAVIDVDRNGAQLVARPPGFDPLRPVPGVNRHVIAGADPARSKRMSQPVGPLLELAVRQPHVAGDQRLTLRHRVDHDLEQVGKVERDGSLRVRARRWL